MSKSNRIRKGRFVEKVDPTAIVIKPAGTKEGKEPVKNDLTDVAQEGYDSALAKFYEEEARQKNEVDKARRERGCFQVKGPDLRGLKDRHKLSGGQ